MRVQGLGLLLGLGGVAHAADDPGAGAVADTIVLITQGSSSCAGAFIGPQGQVATAYHCIADGGPVWVQSHEGLRAQARIVARQPSNDLALLQVQALSGGPWLEVRTGALTVGEPVFAWGHPMGAQLPGGFLQGTLRWSMAGGIVSAVGAHSVQTTAPLNKGSSGGPLVDAEGRLVGVVSRRLGGQGLGFATRADALAALQADPSPGPLLGGSVRAEGLASTWGGSGGVLSLGARVELAVRDRVVLSGTATLPTQPQFDALRFDEVAWLALEGRLGLRQRLGRGYWTTRIDLYGGVGAIASVQAVGEPAEFRTTSSREVVPLAGARLGISWVAVDVAVLPDGPDGLALRTSLALQWPGRLGVF